MSWPKPKSAILKLLWNVVCFCQLLRFVRKCWHSVFIYVLDTVPAFVDLGLHHVFWSLLLLGSFWLEVRAFGKPILGWTCTPNLSLALFSILIFIFLHIYLITISLLLLAIATLHHIQKFNLACTANKWWWHVLPKTCAAVISRISVFRTQIKQVCNISRFLFIFSAFPLIFAPISITHKSMWMETRLSHNGFCVQKADCRHC